MKLADILNAIFENLPLIIIVLATLLEITPIKINPWTTLTRWISNIFNKETRKDIEEVRDLSLDIQEKVYNNTKAIQENQRLINENERDRIRSTILSFANTCRRGVRYSRDDYLHIFSLRDKYTNLLKEMDETNGVFDLEMEYIENQYREKCQNNDFEV